MKTTIKKTRLGLELQTRHHITKHTTPVIVVTQSLDTPRGEYIVKDILFRFYIILN